METKVVWLSAATVYQASSILFNMPLSKRTNVINCLGRDLQISFKDEIDPGAAATETFSENFNFELYVCQK